jgi:hypothetical protein
MLRAEARAGAQTTLPGVRTESLVAHSDGSAGTGTPKKNGRVPSVLREAKN